MRHFLEKSKKRAFSFAEILVSLIIISLITAAFIPVITKKLTSGTIKVGGANGGTLSTDCSHIDENCKVCIANTCYICKSNTCPEGETLDKTTCKCKAQPKSLDCSGEYFMQIGNLCVTKYNMGDTDETAIPSGSATKKSADGYCDAYSGNCCWDSTLSSTYVKDNCGGTGSYSGCHRTVCNWSAANSICSNYKYGNRTWRLPTSQEVSNWGNYITELQLCRGASSSSSSGYCPWTSRCPGAYDRSDDDSGKYCFAYYTWTSTLSSSNGVNLFYGAYSTNVGIRSEYQYSAFSTRCVTEIVPHCKTISGTTCSACETGYYLSNNECKEHTNVDNCKTYSTTEDKCTTCEDNYELSNNTCKEKEFTCSGQYFMQIGNLCVTKYNMGDSDKTTIPSGSANVKNLGTSCGSLTSYTTKCCWQGATSGTDCNSSNGSYSGCDRTVCNWAAANAICANFKAGDKTWRLPTTSEMSSWGTNSKSKGNNGLMLCDDSSSSGSSLCSSSSGCSGTSFGTCSPNYLWSKTTVSSSVAYLYYLSNSSWVSNNNSMTNAQSVRCVTEIVPNCSTISGTTCSACKSGYYLSNNECKQYTPVEL